jgi:hypothetical protein
MIGMVIGLIRMILDFVYYEPPCGEPDTRPGIVKNVTCCMTMCRYFLGDVKVLYQNIL